MPLTLGDISYTYSRGESLEQAALRSVSLDLNAGEVLVVGGATGSGKSTLLRIAAGLLTADSGSATIDGAPLDARSARGRVGLVFQNPEQQLFADTLLDDVAFGPRNLGASPQQAAARAREALESVGLDPEEFGSRSPFSLSGGQARRAAIAGVLAMRPQYLLLDEPSAGLDAPSRAALLGLIAALAAQGTGIAVVTHDLDEFLAMATSALILERGRCAFRGSVDELLDRPEVLESAGLLAPAVLTVQVLARAAGIDTGALTLDIELAAQRLARASLSRTGERT